MCEAEQNVTYIIQAKHGFFGLRVICDLILKAIETRLAVVFGVQVLILKPYTWSNLGLL